MFARFGRMSFIAEQGGPVFSDVTGEDVANFVCHGEPLAIGITTRSNPYGHLKWN